MGDDRKVGQAFDKIVRIKLRQKFEMKCAGVRGLMVGACLLGGMMAVTTVLDSQDLKDEDNLGIYMHGIRQTCDTLSEKYPRVACLRDRPSCKKSCYGNEWWLRLSCGDAANCAKTLPENVNASCASILFQENCPIQCGLCLAGPARHWPRIFEVTAILAAFGLCIVKYAQQRDIQHQD